MCGILGIWTNRMQCEQALQCSRLMSSALAHRGPDDDGIEVVNANGEMSRGESREIIGGPLVLFAHRRLSILDLSGAGHQPMRDPATGNWITFNGEIYNFSDLRAELVGRGHKFRSKCDTEVILKSYAEWGVGCWRRLRGMFAIGLWDSKYQELHLVRDHLGVKPLYIGRSENGLVFASEVRAILASRLVDRRISVEGLNSYLKYGSVQEPCTLVDRVESLPAGHYLTCAPDGRTTVRHYWTVSECLVRNWEAPPRAEEVRHYLEDAVRRQLISDVPVGVFLSGGVDSTVIAALATRARPGEINTFCIGVEQKEFDESAEAALTAKFLGCRHTTLMLDGNQVQKQFDAAIGSYDQPSYDGINTYFISMLVRQAGIKVALSGLGGDELFVGYEGFSKARRMTRISEVAHFFPRTIRRWLGESLAAISPPGDAIPGTVSEVLDAELVEPYFSSRTLFSRHHIERLTGTRLNVDWSQQSWVRREQELSRSAAGLHGVDRVSFMELQTYMLSTLLRDSDQMSMAHGLELRVPLIDPELLEHVLPVAMEEKTTGGVGKQLLFDALGALLPSEVLTRRKRGFTLPFRDWMHRDLQNTVGERFLDIKPQGPWDERTFRQIWHNFRAGRIAWSRVLTLFVLENWLQENQVCC